MFIMKKTSSLSPLNRRSEQNRAHCEPKSAYDSEAVE